LYQTCNIPFRLRRMQYVDFTGTYEKGLANLLRSLELGQATPPPQPAEEPVAPGPTSIRKTEPSPQPKQPVSPPVIPAREPVTPTPDISPPPVRPEPSVSGMSPGKLVAAGVVAFVLLIMVWLIFRSSNPSPSAKSNPTSQVSQPSESQGAREPAQVPPPATGETAPPAARVLRTWLGSFLTAEQGPSVDALRPFFDQTVSPYYSLATADWNDIAKDKQSYFDRFPSIQYRLDGQPTYTPHSSTEGTIEFQMSFSATRKDGKVLTGSSIISLEVRGDFGQWTIAGVTERKLH
jgi:hypothetical protein